MQLSLVTAEDLPCMMLTEHLLPLGRWQISGGGPLFIDTLCEAIRAGGLWLVMHDSEGSSATGHGDVVSLARIVSVDWFADSNESNQIRVDLFVQSWGLVQAKKMTGYPQRLTARHRPLWTAKKQLPADDILIIQLQQGLLQFEHKFSLSVEKFTAMQDPCWLCWRWLELLPLPLVTKQRLLKMPGPDLCLRYLKKMIQQSDLYS